MTRMKCVVDEDGNAASVPMTPEEETEFEASLNPKAGLSIEELRPEPSKADLMAELKRLQAQIAALP